MIEKIKSLSSSWANGQRIAETSERAKMQKKKKKKKKKKERKKEREKEEKEKEKEEEEMEMQAHGLPTSHRGWEASTMAVRVKKKNLFEGVSNFAWGCS